MKRLNLFVIALFYITFCSAQTISDKVSQITANENKFSEQAKQKGIKKAFLNFSDENSIVFRPGPVKAVDFYKTKNEVPGYLSWQPMYARIAKSSDWGFTSGPYVFKQTDTSSIAGYGDYFSVWKRGRNGTWKLAIDIGVAHKMPTTKPELRLENPLNEDFVRLKKQSSYDQREDIVFSNDKLFCTIRKANSKIAYEEFLANNTRLLFPGYEPILGKAAVARFWETHKFKTSSQPIKSDRALSGELAYTYGNASLESAGEQKQYYYLRIWEMQPNYKWAMIVEVLTPG